jgi:Dyp-type peroxidase family
LDDAWHTKHTAFATYSRLPFLTKHTPEAYMRQDLLVKSRSLGGTSDLTLLATISEGLVPSLETITYKTRIKRLLKTLNSGRTSSQEYSLLRAFSDSVERVAKIHSVRVAVVEPNQLLLSVTFDGSMDTYMRVLWQKVGTLLDVIFCNTKDYVSAWGHSYEEWANWVRSVQIETDFFFGTPGLTVDDVHYLRGEELTHRSQPGRNLAELTQSQLLATRKTVVSAEEKTWAVVGDVNFNVTNEMGRQGLRALALMYRLAGVYLPNTADGEFLHRAARDILLEFVLLAEKSKIDEVITLGSFRFEEQLKWLLTPVPPRQLPQLTGRPWRPAAPANVQGGILNAYPDTIAHGCLLLLGFKDRAAAAQFLTAMAAQVTTDAADYPNLARTVNFAITCDGLRAAGLTEDEISLFPQEFREGMEARASLLGDVRTNHPRRWQLPRRNMQLAAGALTATANAQAVELGSVHAVVQIRLANGLASPGETLAAGDPLVAEVQTLLGAHPGVDLLSVQPMLRNKRPDNTTREHFGFVDGLSQPELDPARNSGKIYDRNQVHLGEVLWGYANEAEEARLPQNAADPALEQQRQDWLKDGSFLAVRKLSQNVPALQKIVADAAAQTLLGADTILAKMMGRTPDGNALAALAGQPAQSNDFDYSTEPAPGAQCPFHAHIRRTNPRINQADINAPAPPPGQRTPRLMRRGMSYGPWFDPANPASAAQARGLIFMAYSASLAEQFEVVQRWISGGNSSGGFSGQSDPFMGVPANGQQRHFRFEEGQTSHQIVLDGSTDRLADPVTLVRLQWGAYLFTPSIASMQKMAALAQARGNAPDAAPWSVQDGWKQVQALLAMEQTQGTIAAREAWKTLLEDPEAQRKFESAGAWAAVRTHRNGVLRTPYGVIVASQHHLDHVLVNAKEKYSVSGYHGRMPNSIGEIYLGLDDTGAGCPYQKQANPVNAAIGTISKRQAFDIAFGAATRALVTMQQMEVAVADPYNTAVGAVHWELNLDLKEVIDRALEALSQVWFGLPALRPGEKFVVMPGSQRWDWKPGDPPFYPGHFTAPSRYIFQPNPGASVQQFGDQYGNALRAAFAAMIKTHRDSLAAPPQPMPVPPAGAPPKFNDQAPLASAILLACPRTATSNPAADAAADDLAARTMVGAMMGFLPTVDGNLRLTLNEWLKDGTFWSLRTKITTDNNGTAATGNTAFTHAENLLELPLKKTMQLRPSPELIWRTATRQDHIGTVAIHPGDKIVLALVSATQQSLASDAANAVPDVYPVFGGDRKKAQHPTHACPGYDAAMGALLGVLSAFLEFEGFGPFSAAMRPSVAPLALTLDGVIPKSPVASGPGVSSRNPAPVVQVGRGFRVMVAGDSWVSYVSPLTNAKQNLAASLHNRHGFDIVASRDYADLGNWLYEFYKDVPVTLGKPKVFQPLPQDFGPVAADSTLLSKLLQSIRRQFAIGKPPGAILLSAAGNDVSGIRLDPFLFPNGDPRGPVNQPMVAQTVGVCMRDWLVHALTRITQTCAALNGGVPVPIFLHGYDFPVPDGRHVLTGRAASKFRWLYSGLARMGYVTPADPPAPPSVQAAGFALTQKLITGFNQMQQAVAVAPPFINHVFHVNLTGKLKSDAANYMADWDNELHPSASGFDALSDELLKVMQAKIPTLV